MSKKPKKHVTVLLDDEILNYLNSSKKNYFIKGKFGINGREPDEKAYEIMYIAYYSLHSCLLF